MRKWKYLAVYTTPLLVVLSIYLPGWWSYTALVVLFGVVPGLELFTKASTANLSEDEESEVLKDRVYDWILYGLLPLQWIGRAHV